MAATLYYTPTSCGAASFLVAHAKRLPLKAHQVDLKTHKVVSSGEDFYKTNPNGGWGARGR